MKATDEEIAKFSKLHPRLKQVAALLAHGLESQEIADELNLAYWTITSYVQRLRQAVEFNSTLKLAVFIVRRPEIEKIVRSAL